MPAAEAMDPAATTAAAPAAGSVPKKQPKARKLAKNMTTDERKAESKKRANRREVAKNCVLDACLNGERRLETERYIAAQALANSEELVGKAAVRAVMMMKQEALKVAFGRAVSMPPHPMAISSLTSGRPPLKPRTPSPHAPLQGTQARAGGALSRLAQHRPSPIDMLKAVNQFDKLAK
jgi:hypothetical protein